MQEQPETLFRVLVLAPLRAGSDHATNDGWAAPVRFTRANFDEAMASVAPGVEIDFVVRGRKLRVSHAFRSIEGFRPGALLEQVPALQSPRAAVAPASGETQSSLIDDILSASAPQQPSATTHSAPLEAFVAHPTVRALERAWRGVHWLTEHAADGVVIEAMDAALDDVSSVLELLAQRSDTAPVDLLVVDHPVGPSRRELDSLAEWATHAESMGAPLVANATPALLGVSDLATLATTERRLRNADDPRAVAFRATAAKDVLRWACLAVNGALARPRHAGPVERSFGVQLDEEDALYLGPAVLVAGLALDSFARSGWACPATGELASLPVHAVEGLEIAVEVPTLDEAAEELAAAGIALVRAVPGRGVARLTHAPAVYRPASRQGIAAAAAPHTLGDQLFVARASRTIAQLAAAIPRHTPANVARDAARVALAELFGQGERSPEVLVSVSNGGLEVTLRPRGFAGVQLDELTLGARLG